MSEFKKEIEEMLDGIKERLFNGEEGGKDYSTKKEFVESIKDIARLCEQVMVKTEIMSDRIKDIDIFVSNAIRTISVVSDSSIRVGKMYTSIEETKSAVGEIKNLLKSIVDKNNTKTFAQCKKSLVKKLK